MAQVAGNGQVKLDNGQVVQAQQGGWYDGQQFWNNTLSAPGVINSQSNQVGAGQAVSKEVVDQSDPLKGNPQGTDWEYLQRRRAEENIASTSGAGSARLNAGAGISNIPGGDGGGAGLGNITAPATIDLAGQYKSLYESSGIAELEAELAQKEKEFTEAKGVNSDNPFLSEASRVGREAKLQTLFDDRTKNLRDEIATKRADVETQLNLKLKQFDINSQQAQQALDQFNTLLSMGALDNASGEDIANITRSTGISSSMIMSAIDTRKKESVETQVITSTADNGEVTATVINPQTGDIIKQTSLGRIGNQQNTGSASTKINETELVLGLTDDVRSGRGVRDVFAIYSGLLDPNTIIQIYNANSPHGPAKESAEELSLLGVDTDKFYGGGSNY